MRQTTPQTVTQAQLARELRHGLGLQSGDALIVHSSMKSLGYVGGGPGALIEALLEALGEDGTLLLPCFTNAQPWCDLRYERCRLGLVPETFRTFPGTRRSNDPTHSVVARGAAADALLAGHVAARDLCPGSPLHELALRGGSVLHIGCDLRTCSLIHVAEHLAEMPFLHLSYPLPCRTFEGVGPDGQPFSHPAVPGPGCGGGFVAVQAELERRGQLLQAQLGAATCLKAKGADVLAAATDLLRQDPAALLCARPQCLVCNPRRAFLAARQVGSGGCIV